MQVAKKELLAVRVFKVLVSTVLTLVGLSVFLAITIDSAIASMAVILQQTNLSSKISAIGGFPRSVRIQGISTDGTVIVGRYRPEKEPHDWKWFHYTAASGIQDLKTLGKPSIDAMCLSADGSVIIGTYYNKGEDNHTFRYTESSGFEDLGTMGQKGVAVHAISADGSIMVGSFTHSDQPLRFHAFRYSAIDGFEDLGTMGAESAFARGVSADGSAVVGNFHVANSSDHAFRYSKMDGVKDLGAVGKVAAFATGISDDGSVIVGDFYGSFDFFHFNYYSHVFLYTKQRGIDKLGSFHGRSARVHAIARDGTTFYGSYIDSDGESYAYTAKIKDQ